MDFYHTTHSLAKNIICASCGIIGHDVASFRSVPITDTILSHLSIVGDVYIALDFSCGVPTLDEHRIMVNKEGLSAEGKVVLCN